MLVLSKACGYIYPSTLVAVDSSVVLKVCGGLGVFAGESEVNTNEGNGNGVHTSAVTPPRQQCGWGRPSAITPNATSQAVWLAAELWCVVHA